MNRLTVTATYIRTDDTQLILQKSASKMAYGDPHLAAFTPLVISPGVGNLMLHFQQRNMAEVMRGGLID